MILTLTLHCDTVPTRPSCIATFTKERMDNQHGAALHGFFSAAHLAGWQRRPFATADGETTRTLCPACFAHMTEQAAREALRQWPEVND